MYLRSRIKELPGIHPLFFAVACAAGLAGCTSDSLIVLRHPASVGTGETFSVGAANIILNIDSAGVDAEGIFRDSLHVGVGLPAGWTVVSAKACPAPHFRPLKASVNGLDTNLRNRLLLDTLDACEGRSVSLFPDSGIHAFLAGRSIRVAASPESLGLSFSLKPDTVPNWFGFAGRIEVSVPAGAPADTILDSTYSPVLTEPTAFKALPVYVYLTLTAGQRDTAVRILYFSKTGPLDTAGIRNNSNLDKGALVYRPLTVAAPVAAAPRPTSALSRRAQDDLSIRRVAPGLFLLNLPRNPSGDPARGGVEVLSAAGERLKAWDISTLGATGQVEWDGADNRGRPLPAGPYLLRAFPGGIHRIRAFVLLP